MIKKSFYFEINPVNEFNISTLFPRFRAENKKVHLNCHVIPTIKITD